MFASRPKELFCHGIRALNSRHQDVRRLRNVYAPSCHGTRIWSSSWLLIDFLRNHTPPARARVMDIGCGWGLAGIYCAKRHQADVTGVDIDWDVYPYLHLHARINGVRIRFIHESLEEITSGHFKSIDLLIGADICFWERLVDVWKQAVDTALEAGVSRIVLADPGRATFDKLGRYCEEQYNGRLIPWKAARPYRLRGQIIAIESPYTDQGQVGYAGGAGLRSAMG